MRAKVGFEFEVGHPFQRATLRKKLKASLTPYQYDSLRFVSDMSIYVKGMLYDSEIITSPLTEPRALELADRLFVVLNEIGCKTNPTTGLHVNVSVPKMRSFNPFALLSRLNETKYLKRWNRENNIFSKPWETNFLRHLKGGIGKDNDWVSTNDYEKWKRNCNDFMTEVCQVSIDEKNPTVRRQVFKYEPKRISVSIPYVWERGYLEYRIIGGDYLPHKTAAMNDIQHFIDTTKYSVEYDKDDVETYMRKLYRKYNRTVK